MSNAYDHFNEIAFARHGAEMKILVVADDAGQRRAVGAALEALGTILQASNRQETLRLVATEKPDLMVLDVAMSELDGVSIILAARIVDFGLPVVMLAGDSDAEAAGRARYAGVNSYIRKPFGPAALQAEVRSLLERAR